MVLQKTIANFIVQSANLVLDGPVLLALSSLDDVETMRLAFQRNPQAPQFLMVLPRDGLYGCRQIQQVTQPGNEPAYSRCRHSSPARKFDANVNHTARHWRCRSRAASIDNT